MSAFVTKQIGFIKAEGNARAQAQAAREALKKIYGRRSYDSVRAELLPLFAKAYGVKLVDGAGKAAGTMVLDSEASAYEACRKALQDTTKFVSKKKAAQEHGKAEFTRAQLSAAKKFLALFETAAEAKQALGLV
jgi:hypothetical protein